jgi:hypothetical protein
LLNKLQIASFLKKIEKNTSIKDQRNVLAWQKVGHFQLWGKLTPFQPNTTPSKTENQSKVIGPS